MGRAHGEGTGIAERAGGAGGRAREAVVATAGGLAKMGAAAALLWRRLAMSGAVAPAQQQHWSTGISLHFSIGCVLRSWPPKTEDWPS